jgi:hypothetical protein
VVRSVRVCGQVGSSMATWSGRFEYGPGIFFKLARCGYTLRVTSQASYSPEYITPTQQISSLYHVPFLRNYIFNTSFRLPVCIFTCRRLQIDSRKLVLK